MSQKRLVLKNSANEIMRNMPWPEGDHAFVVYRRDKRRIEVVSNLDVYEREHIEVEVLKEIQKSELEKGPIKLGTANSLELVESLGVLMKNSADPVEKKDSSRWSGVFTSLIMVLFLSFFLAHTELLVEEEEVEKPELVVKIVKQEAPRKVELTNTTTSIKQPTPTKPQASTQPVRKNVKRMGALSVLGTKTNSNQQGGINLGAAKTSRGAGLGGSQGSGGVQKSLYGKGLVNAPVGEGNNLQGGGGYGTKGRGGGQDGYGSLSLTGSAGGNPIPLGKEAIVQGGIDKALIADVVNRNLGQVRFCYEQELQSDPRLAGRVVVGWVIGNDGRVASARIESSTLHSQNVENCILTRLRTWRFPLPKGEGNVDVNYPFLLEKRS